MNTLIQLWEESKTPLDYVLTVSAYSLTALAATGIGVILFELITNPSQFNNTSFGIFDYI